ncbi:hypothetical protein EHH54_03135 [Rhizobium leguminosarum]|uniref:hypothetical protein n=1 Tax=Rhizobium TaxID=379 RepID=UPI000FEC7E15|nr:hypothetical protein [Rhizobium leguminosarum]MDH6270176.1 hypothetical protein [Rhizobium leguminosarum]RWX42317.1 hypothetical protein EHH54_03135 [Rhizobium leguminosarum]
MANAGRNLETEIAEHLAPVLADMDLEIAFTRESRTRAVIDFAPLEKDGWLSPVKIIFDEVQGRELAWDQAHLRINNWGCRKLGETGWVSWKCFHTARHEIKGEGQQALDWLKFVIEYNGLVPGKSLGPKCVVNSNFGDLYFRAAMLFPELEIKQSNVTKSPHPFEYFVLKDSRDREIQIGMRKGEQRATVYINGAFQTEFCQWEHDRFNEIVRDLSKVQPRGQAPLRGRAFGQWP